MIKGVWEWSIVDEAEKTHIIKLDNTEGKKIIYLDEHQIDSIPKKYNDYITFGYTIQAMGKELIIVNSSTDNLENNPPKLVVDGKYKDTGKEYVRIKKPPFYGWIYLIINICILLYCVFDVLIKSKFSDALYWIPLFGMHVLIKQVMNIPLKTNSKFIEHFVRLLLLSFSLSGSIVTILIYI